MRGVAATRSTLAPGVKRGIEALIPVLCPPGWEEVTTRERLIDEIAIGIASMPSIARLGLGAGFRLYDATALAFHGRRARSLRGTAATRHWRRWAGGHGLKAELAKGMRAVIVMAYFELPAVQARIGYTPDAWIAMVKARRLASYADDIARHEASIFERDPLPLPGEIEARDA